MIYLYVYELDSPIVAAMAFCLILQGRADGVAFTDRLPRRRY